MNLCHSSVRWTCLLLYLPMLAIAQVPDEDVLLNLHFQLSPDLQYNTTLPAPADFLGYKLGTGFTIEDHPRH